MDRKARNTQLFQIVKTNGNTLSFQSLTANGELYEAFDLEKEGSTR
ncbi:MAG TPA: hypothetical protein VFO54_01490 [Chryseosolibacter sp.]|nr:hypothetical protein [Chryseosolibacter sp.]